MNSTRPPLVSTIQEKCRMCYTCVRECPAKAIRVTDGQASVVESRCIGCGNCLRVCAKKAKQVFRSLPTVSRILSDGIPVAALIAPSFPAEFSDFEPEQLAGALKTVGFSYVYGVDFGADLVAQKYRELFSVAKTCGDTYISTTCPAVVAFVRKFHPDLISHLAPIVSPMIAMARVIREKHAPEPLKIVFIGPCIGKKSETAEFSPGSPVDSALTFAELRELLASKRIQPDSSPTASWEDPKGGLGGLLPISGGLLQAASLQEDLLGGDIIVAEGKANFREALKEFRKNHGELQFLDILSCNGCIMGAGFSKDDSQLERRKRVSRTVRKELQTLDRKHWQQNIQRFSQLDLTCQFEVDDRDKRKFKEPTDSELLEILSRMGKHSTEDELNCGACGYSTCRGHAIAVHRGLAEVEMCLPHTIETLKESHRRLVSMKEALIQSEKLASMGQLAAGIAHEVNNPLGIILLYSNLLLEKEPANEDVNVIIHHADRCRKIVSGLLNFARQNRVLRQSVDLRKLFDDAVAAVVTPPGITVKTACSMENPYAELDRDQILQVLVNLIANAYAAMPNGGHLLLSAERSGHDVMIRIRDSGIGISPENRQKIFEPFFTTKPVGKGTGLGLAVAHGIIKMHQGSIRVESNTDPALGPTGTTFSIQIPDEGMTIHGVSP